jgi:hypothetical protein
MAARSGSTTPAFRDDREPYKAAVQAFLDRR